MFGIISEIYRWEFGLLYTILDVYYYMKWSMFLLNTEYGFIIIINIKKLLKANKRYRMLNFSYTTTNYQIRNLLFFGKENNFILYIIIMLVVYLLKTTHNELPL